MRRALMLLVVSLAAANLGCGMEFIKKRLPPPTAEGDGSVVFRFDAPSARVVQLAGNWPENDWLRGQAQTGTYLVGKMEDPDGDGIWERREFLPPGRYQYKFVIDEVNWKEDPNNPERVDDGFGGFNSLLIID